MPRIQRDYVGKALTAAVMVYRKGLDHAESHFCHTVIQWIKQIFLYLRLCMPSAFTEFWGEGCVWGVFFGGVG